MKSRRQATVLLTTVVFASVLQFASGQPPKLPAVTLGRHDGTVVYAAYLPDSKSLLTVTYEGAIRKWDAASGKELQQLEKAIKPDGTSPDVRCRTASLSPDGRFLGVLTYASTLNVYEVTKGKPYGQIATGDDQMTGAFAVAFSPDSKTVATGRFHGRGVTVWDLSNGKPVRIFGDDVKPKGTVPFGRTALAFSGKTLIGEVGEAVNGQPANVTLKRWELATGKELQGARGPGHGGALFAPDGKTAAWTNPKTREVRIWDLATDKPLRTLEGTGQARAFSSDSKWLAGRDTDRVLCVWNTATGKLQRRYGESPGTQPLNTRADIAAFSADGKRLVSGVGYEVHQWDVDTGTEIGVKSSRP